MRLKNEIQKSMFFVLATTLLIVYGLTTVLVYRQTTGIMKSELAQEADYIKRAVEISGEDYLNEMDAVRENTRVTWISQSGEVLYDSRQDEVTLENHKNRPEVRKAVKYGKGQDVRESDTLGQEMIYFALRLSDGTVLRVSKSMNTIFHTAMRMLPAMGGIGIVMVLFAVWLSRRQARKLIRPINALDLEQPLENDVYQELTPLLARIDQQNRQQEAASQMRKEFTANVSHELKTPLTSISGYAEIMKNGLVREEDMPVFSERIYHEASRLITLVGDLIKLSRLDEEAVELEKEDVDLCALVREILSRLAPVADGKNVRLKVTGEKVMYRGIRQLLDEMIYNICENAIKYNQKDGEVKVWVGSTLQGAKIIVSDTGIGIPQEDQERIFERFYRVDKSHSKATGGTGLGLSIVKHAALLHNIEICVKSEVGIGTKMELIFDAKDKREYGK